MSKIQFRFRVEKKLFCFLLEKKEMIKKKNQIYFCGIFWSVCINYNYWNQNISYKAPSQSIVSYHKIHLSVQIAHKYSLSSHMGSEYGEVFFFIENVINYLENSFILDRLIHSKKRRVSLIFQRVFHFICLFQWHYRQKIMLHFCESFDIFFYFKISSNFIPLTKVQCFE